MHRISGQWESSPTIPSSYCGCSPITSRMQAPGRRPFVLPSWAERNASASLPVGRAFVPMRLRSRACRYVHMIMPRCRFSAETWQTARPSSPCIPTSRTSTAFPGQAKAGEERLPGRRWSRSSCRESSSRSSPSPLARVCTRCCDRILVRRTRAIPTRIACSGLPTTASSSGSRCASAACVSSMPRRQAHRISPTCARWARA